MPDDHHIRPSHTSEYRREYGRQYRQRPDAKIKIAKNKAKYRETHREELRQNGRKYVRRPEVKPKVAKNQKRHRAKPEVKSKRASHELARLEIKRLTIAGRPRPTCCDICGQTAKKIFLDHCHEHGHFRGWLCPRCNWVLGAVKDDPILLEIMAAYLREPPPDPPDLQLTLLDV